MCRQPQQKSGSKQPWSIWYDRRTEEAMPLVGMGRGGQGGEKQGLSCWRNALPSWMQETGEAGVWARSRERKGKREPKATNPRTLNEKKL